MLENVLIFKFQQFGYKVLPTYLGVNYYEIAMLRSQLIIVSLHAHNISHNSNVFRPHLTSCFWFGIQSSVYIRMHESALENICIRWSVFMHKISCTMCMVSLSSVIASPEIFFEFSGYEIAPETLLGQNNAFLRQEDRVTHT